MIDPTTNPKRPILVTFYNILSMLSFASGAVIFIISLKEKPLMGIAYAGGACFVAGLLYGIGQVVAYIHAIAFWTEKAAKDQLEINDALYRRSQDGE